MSRAGGGLLVPRARRGWRRARCHRGGLARRRAEVSQRGCGPCRHEAREPFERRAEVRGAPNSCGSGRPRQRLLTLCSNRRGRGRPRPHKERPHKERPHKERPHSQRLLGPGDCAFRCRGHQRRGLGKYAGGISGLRRLPLRHARAPGGVAALDPHHPLGRGGTHPADRRPARTTRIGGDREGRHRHRPHLPHRRLRAALLRSLALRRHGPLWWRAGATTLMSNE